MNSTPYFSRGRTLFFITFTLSIIAAVSLIILQSYTLHDMRLYRLVFYPMNVIEYILTILYFVSLGIMFYGLVVKREYKHYTYKVPDILLLVIVVFFTYVFFLTLVFPQPYLFENDYRPLM